MPEAAFPFPADVPADATQLASFTLIAGGAPAPVPGIAGLQVNVTSLTEGITLVVTFSNGNRNISRSRSGDYMLVQLKEQGLQLFPTVIEPSKGVVKVMVFSISPSEGLALMRNEIRKP